MSKPKKIWRLRCRHCKNLYERDSGERLGFCCTSCKEMYNEKKGGWGWVLDVVWTFLEVIISIFP